MSSEMVVGLTSTLEEWTAAAGEGEPVGQMGTMFEFVSPIDGVTPVTVGFTEEVASFMEYTYGDAGPGQNDAQAVVAASIPTESMPGEQFLMPPQLDGGSPFTAQLYNMPSAPNSAILSVMALGNLEAEEAQVVSISLSLSGAEESGYAATGDPGGIGITRDEWIATYGEPADGGAEMDFYPGVGPDGMDIATARMMEQDIIRGIYVNAAADTQTGTTIENAMAFVGSSVPEDSVVGQHFALPATAEGPISLDAVVWTVPSLEESIPYKGTVFSMIYVTDEEPTRIDVVMNSDTI